MSSSIGLFISFLLLVDTTAFKQRILRRKEDGESKGRPSFVAVPKKQPTKFFVPPGHVCKLAANIVPIAKSDSVSLSTSGEGKVEVIYSGDPLDEEGCFSLVTTLKGYKMDFRESRIVLSSEKICLLSSRQKPKALGGDFSKFDDLVISTDKNGNGEIEHHKICLGNFGTIEQVFGATVRIQFGVDDETKQGTLCGVFSLDCRKDPTAKSTEDLLADQRETIPSRN